MRAPQLARARLLPSRRRYVRGLLFSSLLGCGRSELLTWGLEGEGQEAGRAGAQPSTQAGGSSGATSSVGGMLAVGGTGGAAGITIMVGGNASDAGAGLGGRGHTNDRPRRLTCGWQSCCVTSEAGTVRCWGDGYFGQGAFGDVGDEPGETPVAIPLGRNRTPRQMAAGGPHVCALLDDASVKCWGSSLLGQLGTGDKLPRGAEQHELGDGMPVVDLGTGFVPVSVAAGVLTSCAVSSAGLLKCWGQNHDGELGLGDDQHR